MLIRKDKEIPSSEVTPKNLYLNRRKFLVGATAASAALAAGKLLPNSVLHAEAAPLDAPKPGESKLPPFTKSPLSTDEKQTAFKDITNYNNYYEFSTDKYEPTGYAQKFHTRPWTVKVEGAVAKPKTLDLVCRLLLEKKKGRRKERHWIED